MTLFASEEIHRHYRITKKISPFSFFLRWRFFFFSFLWFIISFFLLTLILSLLTWLLILSFLSVSISCNNIEKKFFRFCHLRERHIVCKFCLDKGLSRLPTNRRQKNIRISPANIVRRTFITDVFLVFTYRSWEYLCPFVFVGIRRRKTTKERFAILNSREFVGVNDVKISNVFCVSG